MRSGVIAQKVGMTRVFTDGGEHVPVTVLRLGNCQVIAHRTKDKNGYVAVQLGSGTRKAKERHQGRARPFRGLQGRAQAQARRVPRRGEGADPGRRRDHRGSFRRRPVRRCHRYLDRQGLCRRHEAMEFSRLARHPRRVDLASFDRFDRRPAGSRQDLQEQEDAGSYGRRPSDHAQSQGGADRCRARSHPGRGSGARSARAAGSPCAMR